MACLYDSDHIYQLTTGPNHSVRQYQDISRFIASLSLGLGKGKQTHGGYRCTIGKLEEAGTGAEKQTQERLISSREKDMITHNTIRTRANISVA